MSGCKKSRLHAVVQRILLVTIRHVRVSTWNLVKLQLVKRNLLGLGRQVNSYVEFWDMEQMWARIGGLLARLPTR